MVGKFELMTGRRMEGGGGGGGGGGEVVAAAEARKELDTNRGSRMRII